jgi:hypothetical protein
MAFKKADPKQAFLKIGLYGSTGAGKTLTALLWAEGLAAHCGRRVAFVDTERGTDFYAMAIPDRPLHPEAFDFDAIYTRSLSEVLDELKGLNPSEHGVIVLDSITHMWEAAIEAYEGKMTSIESIPMHAWGMIKKPYKALIKWLMNSPYHVLILGRQKTVFEEVGGQLKAAGVAMKAEGETEYEPNITFRMEAKQSSSGATHLLYVTKDRVGVLESVTRNPTFKTIEPILALLGESQGQIDADTEERIMADSELHTRNKDVERKREERSADIFAEAQGKLAVVTTLEGLGAVSAMLKKSQRYLQPSHLEALKVLFANTSDRILNTAAPKL